MDVLKHIQGGIAAAEIVHPHPEAQFLEAGDLLFDKLEIAAHDAFGDFDGQLGTAYARFVHPAADFLHDIAAFKVRPGQVQGRGHHVHAQSRLPLHLFQNFIQHVQIQLIYQLGFLQHGNEFGGRQEALHRIDPAGQRFFVAHLAVGGADDGLVIHLDPALGKRPVQIAGNVLPPFRFRKHLAVEKRIAGHQRVPVQVAGDLRPVAGLADLDFRICQEDTGAHRQVVSPVEALALFKQQAKAFLDPLGLGKHGEMILPEPGAVFAAETCGQHVAEVQNQLISGGKAIFAVEGFHAAQVDEQNGGFLSAGQHALQARFRQFKKVRHVGQAGEGIVMVLAHHAALPHHAVKGAVQAVFLLSVLAEHALVGIPYVSQPFPRFGIHMLALGVNDDVLLAVRQGFIAVNLVVLPALGGKAHGGVGHAGRVVRMGEAVHIVIHHIIGLRSVREPEHAAKTLGKRKRHHPFIHKLINGKGNGRRLHIGENLRVEPVTLHVCSPLASRSKSIQIFHVL